MAANGDGAKGSAVIATRPPIAPFNIMITSVLPEINLGMIAATITPPQAARFVLIKIVEIATASSNVPNANCEPPLNPNQPSHNTKTPSVTKGIEDAAKGCNALGTPFESNLPVLEPNNSAPANAADPPVEWTRVDPAKSEKPATANQPPPTANPLRSDK